MRATTRAERPKSELAQRTAALRTALRAAVKSGEIALPDGAKLSVRCETASLYSAINVTVDGGPAGWAFGPDRQMTPVARALGERIAERMRPHMGHSWGTVMADCATLASIARSGWNPGED